MAKMTVAAGANRIPSTSVRTRVKPMPQLCLSSCECSPVKCNTAIAFTAGFLFWSGWWIYIGLQAEHKHSMEANYFLPGFFGTIALIIINIIPVEVLNSNSMMHLGGGHCGTMMVQITLLIGCMGAFGTLIASLYILLMDYELNDRIQNKWPGWGIFLQNLCIFTSTILLRFRRSYDNLY